MVFLILGRVFIIIGVILVDHWFAPTSFSVMVWDNSIFDLAGLDKG